MPEKFFIILFFKNSYILLIITVCERDIEPKFNTTRMTGFEPVRAAGKDCVPDH